MVSAKSEFGLPEEEDVVFQWKSFRLDRKSVVVGKCVDLGGGRIF